MSKTEQFVQAVLEGKYDDEPRVPLDDIFENENGTITNLVLGPMAGAEIIESKAGSMRANHYHKTDWHYAYMFSGRASYFWRIVGDEEPARHRIVTPGQMIFTPPMVVHAFYFHHASTMLTLSKLARSKETHEADVVRVKFLKSVSVDGQFEFWPEREQL